MPRVRIAVEAESDIDGIVVYTIHEWRWRQASRYLSRLEDAFDLLARNPSLGCASDSIRAGLRRFEIGSHVVFYLPEPDGMLVVRVLHARMLPDKHI